MKKRYKMKPKASRKLFKKTADRTHYFNVQNTVMRGGVRL